MTWTNLRFGRSACAAAYICLMLPTAPTGVFGRLVAHMHQAFWCSLIEAVALCPIIAITYLRRRLLVLPTLRILQRLGPCLSLLWSEVVCSRAARWVHLVVTHASLSPYLVDTSVAIDGSRASPYGVLTEGVLYLCVVQIAHDITGALRKLQAMVRSEADIVMADADPLFDDASDTEDFLYAVFERLVYAYLAGQALLYGLLTHLFTATALCLSRIAAGTIITAISNAHNALDVCWFYPFTVWATAILIAAALNLIAVLHAEADIAAERERLDRHRRELEEDGRAPRTRMPTANTAIPREMMLSVALRLAWFLEACFRWLVPWLRHTAWLGIWFCPEAVGLWSEDERREYYAEALTGAPSTALAALWDHGPLRRRHVELWRRAGLTMDLALVTEAAGGNQGTWPPSEMVFFLGKMAAILVRGLEATFGVFVVVGEIDIVLTIL